MKEVSERSQSETRSTHPEVTLNEAAHLLVLHNGRITRHSATPALESELDQPVVLLIRGGRGLSEGQSGKDRLRAGDGERV